MVVSLINQIKVVMGYNFHSALLDLGAMALGVHYTILEKFMHCSVFGGPGTEKSTAFRICSSCVVQAHCH